MLGSVRWGSVRDCDSRQAELFDRGNMSDSTNLPAPAQPRRPRRPRPRSARRGSRSRAVRCRWASPGSKQEQAFNFAVHAEHAESVTLLLYSSADLSNPLLAYRFDFLRNKSGTDLALPDTQRRLRRLATTRTRSRERAFLNFTASIRRKFCSTRMRNVFSFPRV